MANRKLNNARFVMHGLLLLILMILQFTPHLFFTFFKRPADLLLCATLMIAMFEYEVAGAAFGFVAGLLMDINMNCPPGFHAGLFMILGAVAGLLAKSYITPNFYTRLIVIALGTLFYKIIYFLIFFAFRVENGFFLKYYLVSVAFTVIIAFPLNFFIRFYRKFFKLPN